jgi:exonuclease SbcC
MIPLKLELKNFLSYGNTVQTVDFTDYHLICFSGRNGHGKSALLDALTWSLWGQARKISGISKADSGLVRLGESQMMVLLEFLFAGHRYKVRREYSKTYGRDYAALDFEVFDEQSGGFKSLSDKTIRATQKKIDDLLGLDFDTFVNSAFLRQGQSNEFSQKTPRERKTILSSILGLGHYETLRARAQEHARAAGEKKNSILMLEERITQELAQEGQSLEELATLKTHEKELALILKDIELKLEALAKESAQHDGYSQEVQAISKQIQSTSATMQEIKTSYFEIASTWRKTHELFLKSAALEESKAKQKLLQEKEAAQRALHQKSLELHELLLKEKERYARLCEILKTTKEKELYALRASLDHLRLELNKVTLIYNQQSKSQSDCDEKARATKQELTTLAQQEALYKKAAENYNARSLFFEKRRVFYQVLVQRGNSTYEELEEIKRKINLTHDSENPSCPLCEQVLTIKRKQFLSGKFETHESFLLHRFERIKHMLPKLKGLLIEDNKEIAQLKEQHEAYQKLKLHKENLEKIIDECTSKSASLQKNCEEIKAKKLLLEEEIKKLEVKHAALEQDLGLSLKKDPELAQLLQKIEGIEKERLEHAYDKSIHEQIAKELKALEEQHKEFLELENQEALQKERRFKTSLLREEFKRHKAQLLLAEKRKQELLTLLEGKHKLDEDSAALKNKLKAEVESKDLLIAKKAALENTLKRYSELKGANAAYQKEIKILELDAYDYEALAQIMGKNGIQAVLIDQAIPEIEDEANRILSRLSDNNAHILIESLRDLKKGGVRETLDINISDTAGIRSYEMFSGGEAFRIDFALRIAISKLLARRAGTALQTLIIDEGFGSQDEEGLNHLMDALRAIKDDFLKIIIVSHLPIFKENFPVHFLIQKTPTGSSVQVLDRR